MTRSIRLPLPLRLLVVATCSVTALHAQQTAPEQEPTDDRLRSGFGLFANVSINRHRAQLDGLPGIPSCSRGYTSASGMGPVAGIEYMFPVEDDLLLTIRGAYVSSSATLAQEEAQTVEIDGDAVPITIEYSIDASLASLTLMPGIGWRASRGLILRAGGEIGVVVASDFVQRERLSDDEPRGTFDTGERVRNEASGAIPGAAQWRFAANIGASYDVPLNAVRTLIAAPEIVASIGLTPVIEGASWSAHALRLGVSLRYSPIPLPPAPPPLAEIATPLEGSIRAVGLSVDGTEEPVAHVRVEEIATSEVLPLLPYVFFDGESASIPQRYARLSAGEAAAFGPGALHGRGTLASYHELLNIIGRRLAERSEAHITLTGTTSGGEAGGRRLSQRRAEAVREYLTEIWSVDGSRIDVRAVDLPSVPSNTSVTDGIAENRRVEITSDDPEVLAPVRTSDTLRATTPPGIRFYLASSDSDVVSWRIIAMQNGEPLKELAGRGPLPPSLDWQIERDQASVPRAPGSLQYRLSLEGRDGGYFVSDLATLPVEQVTLRSKQRDRVAHADRERYNLILFAFDRAQIGQEHMRLLAELREKIPPAARVIVVGYADRTGSDAHNARLALARAQAVARELGVSSERVEVRGETTPRYDQSLPEGRFHSRGVDIEILTPVEVEGESGL